MNDHGESIKDAKGFLKYLTANWPGNVFLHVESMTPVMSAGRKPDISRATVSLADIDTLGPFGEERNWYYTVNPLSGPSGNGEGGAVLKTDIACAVCIHLDLDPADPPAGASPEEQQAHLQAERRRLRQQLADFEPAPSFIIDSTGGYQAIWQLKTPATVAEAEAVNRALCTYFKTPDKCHSAQHLMRMSFTFNVPGYKKLAKGRTRAKTRLLTATDVAYALSDFDFLPRPAAASRQQLAVTGDLPPRFVELLAGDEDLRKRWEGNTEGLNDTSRNALDMSLTSLLVKRGFNDTEITQILQAYPHSKVMQDGRGDDYIRAMLDKARAQRDLSPADPLTSARRMVAERFTSIDGVSLLRHWNGDTYLWRSGAYHRLTREDVDARIQAYLEGARRYTGKASKAGKQKTEPFKPTPAKVANVRGTLEAAFHLDSRHAMPCWLDGSSGADPRDLLVVANGTLHLLTRTLQQHDPRLFTTTALPFAYAPDSGPPKAWLEFLASVWGDDAESIETLQEFFGYCLTADCSQQKIFLVVGPKRSGKGTIARVLRAVIGEVNCAGPTLASLATNFGLQPLIGKRLGIISDARLGNRTDKHALTERLCSISGEDALTIDIKNRDAWTGTLGVRLIMFTNELPKIADDSNALSSRFIVLRMTKSFFGKEDLGLADRLLAELPAILNWSLDGLERLKLRGAFRQPASAQELVQELEDLTSPIGAFIRDCCVVGLNEEVETHRLYGLWETWRRQHGWNFTDTKEAFGASLRAAVPGLEKVQTRAGGDRRRVYRGIGIATGTSTLEDLQRGTSSGMAAVADLDAVRAKKRALLL